MYVTATKAFFIKLGRSGMWETECLSGGFMRVGFHEVPHQLCAASNWEKVNQELVAKGKSQGNATRHTNELEKFYASEKTTLWITFSDRRLYWGFASGPARLSAENHKERTISQGWSCKDANGVILDASTISSRLTQVASYQGTICEVKELSYLLNRINAEPIPEAKIARDARDDLLLKLVPLIQNLTWRDFETLVDMAFTAGGWRRMGVLGKEEKDIDLELQQPVTGERLFVQVKARSTPETIREISKSIAGKPEYHRAFAVTHSFEGKVPTTGLDSRLKIMQASELAKLVLNAGLTDWLLDKSR